MVKVGGKPGGVDMNVFDQRAKQLREAADDLQGSASKMLEKAKADVHAAGDHGAEAIGHLAGAGANAVMATGAVIEGTVDVMAAGGHAIGAGGYAVAGAGGWAAEGVASAGRFVSKNLARAFAALANMMTNVLKDGKTCTVKELAGDPNAVRFSEEMFGKAAEQLNKSADHMAMAWNSYVEAVDHLAGAGANVVYAAAHTAAVAGHLAKAVGEVGLAGLDDLAAVGLRAAAVAVEFAEKGMEGARDAAILSAKISAATANALAIAGQGKVEVKVGDKIAAFEKELEALQAAS